jgi:hypothetical protein
MVSHARRLPEPGAPRSVSGRRRTPFTRAADLEPRRSGLVAARERLAHPVAAY